MLALTKADLAQRAENFVAKMQDDNSSLSISLIEGESAVGGGSGPNTRPPTVLIAIEHAHYSADEIERRLRSSDPPIIARVSESKLLVDLRTVFPAEEPELARALRNLSA